MFGGQDMYNAYAHTLQDLWEVKWPVRAGLLGLVIIHIVLAIGLVAKNRAARPVPYAVWKPVVSSAAGRTMAYTGLVVFAFLAFHIVHFTIGMVQPGYFHHMDPKNRYDAYSMFVYGFQNSGHLRRLLRRHLAARDGTSATARRAGCSRSVGAIPSTSSTGSAATCP